MSDSKFAFVLCSCPVVPFKSGGSFKTGSFKTAVHSRLAAHQDRCSGHFFRWHIFLVMLRERTRFGGTAVRIRKNQAFRSVGLVTTLTKTAGEIPGRSLSKERTALVPTAIGKRLLQAPSLLTVFFAVKSAN